LIQEPVDSDAKVILCSVDSVQFSHVAKVNCHQVYLLHVLRACEYSLFITHSVFACTTEGYTCMCRFAWSHLIFQCMLNEFPRLWDGVLHFCLDFFTRTRWFRQCFLLAEQNSVYVIILASERALIETCFLVLFVTAELPVVEQVEPCARKWNVIYKAISVCVSCAPVSLHGHIFGRSWPNLACGILTPQGWSWEQSTSQLVL